MNKQNSQHTENQSFSPEAVQSEQAVPTMRRRLLTRRSFAGLGATVLAASLMGCTPDSLKDQVTEGSTSIDAPQPQESASAQDPSRTKSSSQDLTPITFALDWTPNTNHTGLYVAQALGYYADEGLEVTLVQPPDGDADALVATDNAQFGMAFQDLMAGYLGSDDPLPVTAVAAVIQHNTSGIMSREGEGVESAAGMAGKRYGTWDAPIERAIVENIVATDGGDATTVEFVPANSSDEVSGLRTDQFDTVWVYAAWALQNAYVQGYPVDYFAIADINPVFDYYTPVIIANDTFLADHPDQARGFLRATAKGYEYAAEHPEEAVKILTEAAPEIDYDLALASQQYLADQYIADASQWGIIDADRWNAFYQWLNDEGLVEVPIPDNTGFTNEYLPEA